LNVRYVLALALALAVAACGIAAPVAAQNSPYRVCA